MKNPVLEARLLNIKAWLYFFLVLLTGTLAIVLYEAIFMAEKNIAPIPICGNSAVPLSRKVQDGKELFTANCASCHNKNMRDKLTGPPLGGVRQRWSQYPEKDLYDFIRTPQRMIRKGHPRAKAIWKEYRPTRMSNFRNLTDAEIESILAYIDHEYTSKF